MDAWKRNLFVTWIAQIFSISGFQFIIPFLPFFIQDLGITDKDQISLYVGIISAVPALTMGAMAIVWGMLSDKMGKKIMLLRATCCGAILMFAMSRATSITDVIIIRSLQGLLTGTMTASTTLVAAGTPRASQSRALGFFSSSTFLGLTLGPFIGGIAAAAFGYRTSFLIGAAALACAFFLILFFVQEIKPDSIALKEEAKTQGAPLFLPLLGGFTLIFIVRFSRALVLPYTALYVQTFITSAEAASLTTGNIIALIGIATAIAGILLVRFEGAYRRRHLLITYIVCATLSSVPIFFQQSIFGFATFNILTMFFIGGMTPLVQSSIGGYLRRDKQGIAFGWQTMIGCLGWFIAPLIGAAITIRYQVTAVFLFLTMLLILGSIAAYFFFERVSTSHHDTHA